jgi:hypothetical protein
VTPLERSRKRLENWQRAYKQLRAELAATQLRCYALHRQNRSLQRSVALWRDQYYKERSRQR